MMILTPKMVENIFGIVFILTAAKNYTSNFADSLFDPIILPLQINPSLHLPISTIFNVFSKIFQIIVDLQKWYFFLFLNIL